jgi:hypothetical protein
LDSKVIKKLIQKAGEQLSGEWILAGGVLLPALDLPIRSTVDVDLWGLGSHESSQQLELMKLSESLGLPVDTINQAGAFFLNKVGYVKDDLIILHKGSKATVFRPSVALYWRLKVQRFTETDAQDCSHYLKFCRQVKDPVDLSELRGILQAAQTDAASAEKRGRIRKLLGEF